MAKKRTTKKRRTTTTEAVGVKKEPKNLKELLKVVDVLLMLYPRKQNGYYTDSIKPVDEISVYKLLREKKDKKKNLIIFLDTSGGNVYSAVKIMDTLRVHYKEITIAIAQEAKSSGTMMCCGANRLIMGPISELGPLDKPMTHPDDETAVISALDIVKSIDGMIDSAVVRQLQMADSIHNNKRIPMESSLKIAGKAISELISPMLCREDVKVYNQAQRLLTIAEKYSEELLNDHMFNYIDDKDLREKIYKLVVRRLVWLYPDHSFAIRRNELKKWFFVVVDSEKKEYWDELWEVYEENIGKKNKLIKYLEV